MKLRVNAVGRIAVVCTDSKSSIVVFLLCQWGCNRYLLKCLHFTYSNNPSHLAAEACQDAD